MKMSDAKYKKLKDAVAQASKDLGVELVQEYVGAQGEEGRDNRIRYVIGHMTMLANLFLMGESEEWDLFEDEDGKGLEDYHVRTAMTQIVKEVVLPQDIEDDRDYWDHVAVMG
jgi:hypothetical protein